jgi:3-hydroxyacyl-[acyl-carrier-protein] dehydratase
MSEPVTLDIHAIMERIPHRFPFLLVDRVLELVPGQHVRALKNVTVNEPFFPGHFPHRPVMPGVMIIEALAQAAGILAFVTAGVSATPTTRFYFAAIDNARFRRPVEPGDQLVLNAKLERNMRGILKFSAHATVGDAAACSCDLMVALDPEDAKRVEVRP